MLNKVGKVVFGQVVFLRGLSRKSKGAVRVVQSLGGRIPKFAAVDLALSSEISCAFTKPKKCSARADGGRLHTWRTG